jgi:malate dehydrogenase (oxaloacetate-decarboxylating)(NADP+)
VKASVRTLVFPEADDSRVIRACRVLVDDGIAKPVLLGNPATIEAKAKEVSIDLRGIEVVDISKRETVEQDIQEILQVRGRHGMTASLARQLITTDPTVVALMMVRKGLVDGAVAGIHHGYPETIRMALKLVGISEGVKTVAGVHVMVTKKGPMFFADTTVNIEPDATHLADIAIMTARFTRELGMEPHVAMLCFSNFGGSPHPEAHKVREAVRMVQKREPDLDCDGEIQAQVALDEALRDKLWPQCKLKAQPNVLVFPNLGAANTAYQLVSRLGGAEEIGPVLLGLRRPVTVISPRAPVNTIVQMAAMTALHGIKGSSWGRATLA